MNLYQQAVWNELKNTLAAWDLLVERSQNYQTAHEVPKARLDALWHKINGLMAKLDQAIEKGRAA